jgi:hypothetical protein
MIKNPSWFRVIFCLISGIILFTKGHAQSSGKLTSYSALFSENLAARTLLSGTAGQRESNDSQYASNSHEKILREDFMIFPNSNKGNVILKYCTQRQAAFQIYDASGRLMFFRLLDQGENLVQMKTSLPEGVYIYTINDISGHMLKTAKLVVVK